MIKGVKLMSVNELSSTPVTCMLGLLAWLKVRKFQNEILVYYIFQYTNENFLQISALLASNVIKTK